MYALTTMSRLILLYHYTVGIDISQFMAIGPSGPNGVNAPCLVGVARGDVSGHVPTPFPRTTDAHAWVLHRTRRHVINRSVQVGHVITTPHIIVCSLTKGIHAKGLYKGVKLTSSFTAALL